MTVNKIISDIENHKRTKYPNEPFRFDITKPVHFIMLKDKINKELCKLGEIHSILNK